MPCQSSLECIGDVECEAVPLDAISRTEDSICTIRCPSGLDQECDENPFTTAAGYCGEGFCRLAGTIDQPCDRDQQCLTNNCRLDPSGAGGLCAE
jgi:hypothetical protein